MAEYQLYCFAQSGNSYRAALMLKLIGADWQPVFVDFFRGGVQRSADYRTDINEMGEAPVLVHGDKKLTQSGVILTYLAERSGKFQPRSEDDRLEALRWIIFDNQKVSGYLGPYRFLRTLAKPPGHPAVLEFFKGRIDNVLGILDKRLATRPFVVGHRRPFARRLPLLPAGGVRLRHHRGPREHRCLAQPHQGATRLDPSLRADAGVSAAAMMRERWAVIFWRWRNARAHCG
jgi:glutathione S-transferase